MRIEDAIEALEKEIQSRYDNHQVTPTGCCPREIAAEMSCWIGLKSLQTQGITYIPDGLIRLPAKDVSDNG